MTAVPDVARSGRRMLACALVLLGCDNGQVVGALKDLREQQRLADQRLRDAQREERAIEVRIEKARAEARRAECHADLSRLEAEAARASGACAKRHAEWSQCRADVAKTQADDTIFGCLFGLGAAVLTGGAAGPLATAGCVGGRLLSEEEDVCRQPKCDSSEAGGWDVAVARRGNRAFPSCGGSVGVELENAPTWGARVDEVEVGGELYRMGVRKGDVVISIGRESVLDRESFERSLLKLSVGAPVELTAVRLNDLRTLHGLRGGSSHAGVRLGAQTEVRTGRVRIGFVTHNSPASVADIRRGDTVVSVDGESVHSARSVQRLIFMRATGDDLRLELSRAGLVFEVIVKVVDQMDLDDT